MTATRPKVVTKVTTASCRTGRVIDLTQQPHRATDLPDTAGGRVIVDVADGVPHEDIKLLVRLGAQVRSAAVVEIRGRTPEAVEHARKLLVSSWEAFDTLTGGGRHGE